MKIALCAARVYGSKSQYGHAVRTSPREGSIVLDSYPTRGERSYILLGEAPEAILRAKRVRQAIGVVALRGGFAGAADPYVEREALIKKALEDGDRAPAIDYNWYVTVVIERELDIPSAEIAVGQYFWLDVDKAMQLEEDFGSYASPHLDLLTTCAATVVDVRFFEEVVLNDRVLFAASGRETFGLPHFEALTPTVVVSNTIESLDVAKLEQLLSLLAASSLQEQKSLLTVSHWYLTALRETDPWKRFLFTFFALEVLVNKLADQVYDDVCMPPAASGQADQDNRLMLILQLIRRKQDLSLSEKFNLVAMWHFPDKAVADLEEFNNAKQARDKLAHGAVKNVEQLPTAVAYALLVRYLATALDSLAT